MRFDAASWPTTTRVKKKGIEMSRRLQHPERRGARVRRGPSGDRLVDPHDPRVRSDHVCDDADADTDDHDGEQRHGECQSGRRRGVHP